MAHGVAAALGVHCRVPHGLACAVMLPVAMQVNRQACEEKLANLASPLMGQAFVDTATAAAASIQAIESLGRDIGIPASLGELGVKADQLDALIASSRGNSMNGNPRDLSDAELRTILEAML
jgi:alcohol dehydrogenase class IV